MEEFTASDLKKLYSPDENSSGEQNGQVTIIGGSKLFHGAPILSLKAASRIVDMVFFASPEPPIGKIAEKIRSELMSFIWIPWEQIGKYIEKSDAVLVGPGFMSFRSESDRRIVEETKKITQELLSKYSKKRWVIDAGSLQVMEADWIPGGSILTPNRKEFEILFKTQPSEKSAREFAEEYNCTIVLKGPETVVCSPGISTEVKGGNAGLTKGGSGDILAGLTVALFAKNEAHLSACAASFVEKKAAEKLHESVETNFNADDLADIVPEILFNQLN